MNEFPKAQNIKQAVLSTLAYFDLFGVALTRGELSEHLLFAELDEQKIDLYLKETPLVHTHDGYLSVSKSPDFWAEWEKKQVLQKEYFKKVRRVQKWLALCPFIQLIAVCNTLPIGDVKEDSDIDLFVITKKNRLFLGRLCLTILTTVLGVRRHGNKIRKRLCLSFYISEEQLNMEEIALQPMDLYLAMWIKTLEPIVGAYSTYEQFLMANTWIRPYFQTIVPKKRYFKKTSGWASKVRAILEWFLDREKFELDARNQQLARIAQKTDALPNRSGTVISDTMLKFHDNDARESLQNEWIQKVKSL